MPDPRTLTRRTLVLLAVIVAAWALGGPPQVAAGGGRPCHTEVITEGGGVSVAVSGFCYRPTVLHVSVGQTVSWTNRDQAPHTVSGANGAWGDYQQFGLDETVSFTFDAPGTYPYVCTLHPLMVGAVVVGDGVAPAAATQPDATADGSALPPLAWGALGVFAGAGLTGAGTMARRRSRR